MYDRDLRRWELKTAKALAGWEGGDPHHHLIDAPSRRPVRHGLAMYSRSRRFRRRHGDEGLGSAGLVVLSGVSVHGGKINWPENHAIVFREEVVRRPANVHGKRFPPPTLNAP